MNSKTTLKKSLYFSAGVIFIIGVLSVISTPALSRELALLITYGRDAQTIEGDDDYMQVNYIRVPSEVQDTLYIRIFDADCGGKHDEKYKGIWNTQTRFRLLGGEGAYSAPGLKKAVPDDTALDSGTILAEEVFGEDNFRDSKWYTFAEVKPDQGEEIAGFRYFKLVVQGQSGDDGNAFLITATLDPRSNTIPENIDVFTLKPTIRLPRNGVFSEMRFFLEKGIQKITVHNFDLFGAKIGVDTAFRTNIHVPTSGQNEWVKGDVILKPDETNRICALRFEGGREMPNDGSFYVTDSQGNLLPIELTVFLQKPNQRPDPRIDVKQLADCNSYLFDGSRTVDKEGDELKFYWDFGDGSKSVGIPVTHKYNLPGKYQANVIIEDNSGQIFNSIRKKFTVTVNHPPIAHAGADQIAAPNQLLNFNGLKSTDTDGKVVRYYWNFGDDQKSRGKNVKHNYKIPGQYTITLRVEDNSNTPCNSASDQCIVAVNSPPLVNIGEDLVASVDEPVDLSGKNSDDSDGKIISYQWKLGDETRKTGMNVTHAYSKPGTFLVKLVVTDNSGAINHTGSDTLKVVVNEPPVADAGKDVRGSAGEPIMFNPSGSLDRDGRVIQFYWDFGDKSPQIKTKTAKIVSHSYKQPGKYIVSLTITDNSGTSTATHTDTASAMINHPPMADAGPDQIGIKGETRFDASGSYDSDGRVIKYEWSYGDGETGTGKTPHHVYRNPGTYKISLTVTDDSKTATNKASDQLIVTVNHLPVADAGPDFIAVSEQELTFDASKSIDPDGQISEYSWDFGDGSTGTGVKTRHTYSKPGKYNALLTVRDNSGHKDALAYDEVSVFINRSPAAAAGPDLVVAPNQDIVFDGNKSYDTDGKIVSYRWDFSDQKHSAHSVKIKRKFSKPGIYTATLTVIDNNRVANSTVQDKVSIRVNHPPYAYCGKNILTSKRTVLLDASSSTDADGDLLTYIWDFGDGSPAGKGERVFHTYDRGGNYPVILTIDDGTGLKNSTSSASISIKINEPPIARAGKNRTVCTGKPVIFDAGGSSDPEGGLMKYTWNFGDNTTATGLNPVKTYTAGGVYMVTLNVMDDSGLAEGSVSTEQIAVTVVESPVADAGPDQTTCAGTPIQFNGSKSMDVDGLVNNFLWNFGDGSNGGGPTPTHTFEQAGTYRVELRITGDQIGSCNNTDTDEMIVTIHKAPVAKFTAPKRVEKNQLISFNAEESKAGTTGITEYIWDFGDNTKGKGKITDHAYPDSGRYIVTLTVISDSITDCNKTAMTAQITVNEPPAAKINTTAQNRPDHHDYLAGTNQIVTFNGAQSLDPDGIISSYIWNFGDGQTGKGVHVRHQYKKPGQYSVKLKVTDNTDLSNNFSIDSITITVNEAPTPIITGGNITVCAGNPITLNAGKSVDNDGKIISYEWNFGDGSPEMEGKQVKHEYQTPGSYMVTLRVNDGTNVSNSRSQSSATITINNPPTANAGSDKLVSPGDKILFDGSKSKDRDGSINVYKWEFGQTGQAQGKKVFHRFKNPGSYNVILTVADNSGTGCSVAEDTAVIRVNSRPVAVIKGETESFIGGAHDTVLFDATDSYDPDDDPLSFYWNFGDGNTAKGPKVSHVFNKPGRYKIKLRVDDGNGLKSSVSVREITIQVRDRKKS